MSSDAFFPLTRKVAFALIDWLKKRPALHQFMLSMAYRHDDMMGYRKYGLLQDDIIPEDHPVVIEAISRLSDKEAFDRTFRIRRAIQLNMTHQTLPASEQPVRSEADSYLWRHIETICRERDEKAMFEEGGIKTLRQALLLQKQ